MVAKSGVLTGVRGSLPTQLLSGMGGDDVRTHTAQFVEYVNKIVDVFQQKLSVSGGQKNFDFKFDTPPLWGRNVRISYIGSGSAGTVYKMQIGDDVFALKINRRRMVGDIDVIDMYPRVKNVVNRPYIAGKNDDLTWIVSDYVAADRVGTFTAAREKLFFNALIKGMEYHDWMTVGNIRDGRVVDYGGLTRTTPALRRVDLDMVKRLAHCMRTDDMARFNELADRAVRNNPAAIRHMYLTMCMYSLEIPERFIKFRQILREKNAEIPTLQKNQRLHEH